MDLGLGTCDSTRARSVTELETALLEAMLKCGASSSLAEVNAVEVAAALAPKIEREKRDQAIRDLFPHIGWRAICDRFHIHNSTAYRILRFPRKSPALAEGSE